jgi:3-demethoxyubiquinol 3-hydroxylase
MSRHPRGRVDAAIVGGGVVGLSAALALARSGLQVVLAEAVQPTPWNAGRPDLRVYALAPDNVAWLQSLDAWTAIATARAQPYRRMRVWDGAAAGELLFDADTFGRRELGWIVEHGLLVDRLWQAVSAAGVRILCPSRISGCEQDADGVRLQLDDGTRLETAIAIAADGADSTLRQLAGIGVARHDYGQRGVVAYVDTERPHEATAWQRFLPGGPLAFLPCRGGEPDGHRSSIVWTLPDADGARLLADDATTFEQALERAFDGRLGRVHLASPRAAFPLRRQLADACLRGRVVVVGDAAHVVHPLAGQGVNLGLRDVAALCASGRAPDGSRTDWIAPARLARWARLRTSENTVAAHTFDTINRIFRSDAVAATLLRGPLLGLAGRLPPLVHGLWRRASGLG